MGAGVVLLQALLIAIALSWVAIGWMQIHRDIRYFVSKGFSGTEYLYWFLGMTGEGNELKFFGLSIVVILLLALVIPATVAIVGFLASPSLMTPNWDYSNSWELVVTVAILAIASSLIVTLLIRKRPQDHEKLQANLTPRC